MCDCPAHRQLVTCTCSCDHTDDRVTQWRDRAEKVEAEAREARAEAARLREALRNIDAYVRRGDDHLDKAPFAAEVICRMAHDAIYDENDR